MKFIRSHIARKVAVSTTLIMIVILTVFFIITFQQDKQNIQESAFREIEAVGLTLINQINAIGHLNLTREYPKKDDINKDNMPEKFKKLCAPLQQAYIRNKMDTPIYTLSINEVLKEQIVKEPDRVYENGTQFILMSAENPFYKHYYRYHPRMKKAFFNKQVVRFPPYKDEHGIWISVYVPVITKSGDTIAILEIDKHMDELYTKNSNALYKKLGLMIILNLIGILIVSAVSLTIVRPLKKLTDAAEIFGDGNYQAPIRVESLDEVGTLSNVMDSARKEISGFVTRILDVIPGLMFTIGNDGRIASHVSKTAKEVAGKEVAGESMSHVFFDDQQSVTDVVDMAFDPAGVLPFKDLMDLLPAQLEKDGNIFKLIYLPVLMEGHLKDIFVFGRDVTEESRLKKQIAAENRTNKMFISIIKNRVLFDSFVDESNSGFQRAFELLDQKEQGADEIGELFRITHSVKGSASTLNLYTIADPAHQFEDDLAKIRKKGVIESPGKLKKSYITLNAKLQEIIGQVTQLMGIEEGGSQKIENWEIDAIEDGIKAGDISGTLKILEGLNNPSLHSYVISKAGAVFERTLEMLDEKKADIKIHSDKARVSIEVVRALDIVLSHGIRNAMDHGLEEEMERMDAGKDLKGRITVLVQLKDKWLNLEIKDDGRGMNPEIIAEKAIEKGIITEEQAITLSEQEKINLVTFPGFSTAGETTEVSGRGVGMDAVKTRVESMGGNLTILSQIGKGSTLQVRIPIS